MTAYSNDDDQLSVAAEKLVTRLTERQWTIALAESCTGGLIAKVLTDIPGASAVFVESLVTYANESKMQRLKVKRDTLETEGAVSEACVREMASGLIDGVSERFGMAVSGIAGPGGGTEEKPVGTVFLALADGDRIRAQRCLFSGDRESVRYQTAIEALQMILRTLEEGELYVHRPE